VNRRSSRQLSLVITMAFAFLASLISAFPARAQGTKGAIAGRAADSAGGLLQGASVHLQPGDAPTGSDAQGDFTINDLTPGEYTLTVSFVGLAAFEKNIVVRAGETARVEAALQIATRLKAKWRRGHTRVSPKPSHSTGRMRACGDLKSLISSTSASCQAGSLV